MSKLAELLNQKSTLATPATPATPGPEIGNFSRGADSETLPVDEERAARRNRAVAGLYDDTALRYAAVPDTSGDPVILTLAIRGVPTPGDITVCELEIPAHRYDWRGVVAALAGDRPEGNP